MDNSFFSACSGRMPSPDNRPCIVIRNNSLDDVHVTKITYTPSEARGDGMRMNVNEVEDMGGLPIDAHKDNCVPYSKSTLKWMRNANVVICFDNKTTGQNGLSQSVIFDADSI